MATEIKLPRLGQGMESGTIVKWLKSEGGKVEMSEQVTEIGQPSAHNGGRVKASPLARRIARERGIDLSAVAGTGPDGRVVAVDVERSAASAAPAQLTAPAAVEGVEVQQLSSMRK